MDTKNSSYFVNFAAFVVRCVGFGIWDLGFGIF